MTWVALGVGVLVGIALGVLLGGWLRALPHRRKFSLVREVYKSIDEVIGATKEVNQQRADFRFTVIHKRRWYWWFFPKGTRKDIADYLWPVPQVGTGTAALPSVETMEQYVQMGADRGDWTIGYTSEAAANREVFLDYLIRGHPTKGGGLAQALGLEWRPDMFDVTWYRSAHKLRLVLRDQEQDQLPAGPPMDVRAQR